MPNYGRKEQLYKDVLTIWYETGQYWSHAIGSSERDRELNVLSCTVLDYESGDDDEHTITLDTVQTGFQRLINGDIKAAGVIKAVAAGYTENDAGNMDAYDCDAVVQAGLFNEIIYG